MGPEKTHLASNGTLVGGLALDGEGNTVGGLGLDLQGGCRDKAISRFSGGIGGCRRTRAGVVEVLVQELSGAISFDNSFSSLDLRSPAS